MLGWIRKVWRWLRIPSAKYSSGVLLVIGGVAGLTFWGGFSSFLEYSNKMEFCISCHEMRTTVYEEYKKTSHFSNPSGVQVSCSDCHVPRPFGDKMVRKVQATFKELPHKIMGTVDTPEKFEAKRLELAEEVWASMEASDSQECRSCHSYDSMDFDKQARRAMQSHEEGIADGETCIDCHKGIAHKPVHEELEEEEEEQGFDL